MPAFTSYPYLRGHWCHYLTHCGVSSQRLPFSKSVEEGADDGVQEVHEDEIDEAVVEVPVNELAELMQLAGYTDYAEKIEEYANEPDPEYLVE